jgi:hypothetical protein
MISMVVTDASDHTYNAVRASARMTRTRERAGACAYGVNRENRRICHPPIVRVLPGPSDAGNAAACLFYTPEFERLK